MNAVAFDARVVVVHPHDSRATPQPSEKVVYRGRLLLGTAYTSSPRSSPAPGVPCRERIGSRSVEDLGRKRGSRTLAGSPEPLVASSAITSPDHGGHREEREDQAP